MLHSQNELHICICILYDMYNRKNTFDHSLNRSIDLFNVRMFRHYDDGLFTTSYALRGGKHLEDKRSL
jgi:hypothetical protein